MYCVFKRKEKGEGEIVMMNINVNNHSSIRIGDIYVDPFKIDNTSIKAKYIFITHSHYDHLSFEDIEKIVCDKTVFIGTVDVIEKIKERYLNEVIVVEKEKEYQSNGVKFSTFPSYNINKNFHPLSNGWVGYVIEVDNVKYCIIGDSDLTDEVKLIKCDVLFVPIGGTYTMNAKEGAMLANIIKPNLVIPVHYNSIVGNKDDEKEFLNYLENIECKILL